MSFRCFPPKDLTGEDYRKYVENEFQKWLKYQNSIDWDNFIEPEDPPEK